MFRPKLLFTSLAALALGACSPQDPQAVTSAAIAKQVILPTYSRWVEADRQLAVSALAYCQGKESLETARADFLHAQKAWAELQPLLIGPLAEGNRSWQVQFWPDKKNLVGRQVEQLVTAQPQIDAAALAKSSVVVQGLSAYEYILYDARTDVADETQKARYCPLLVAIGERQKALAEEILASWNSTDGMLAQMTKFPNQRYADSHEAIADLLRAQVTALDTLKKKTRHADGSPDQGHRATVPGRCLAQPVFPAKPAGQPRGGSDRVGRGRQQRPAWPAAVGAEAVGRQDRRRLCRVAETVRRQPAHPQ